MQFVCPISNYIILGCILSGSRGRHCTDLVSMRRVFLIFAVIRCTVFYEAIIPAQKAGSTVYWLIVVTNENGLSSVTEAQQYSVYAI